MLTYCNSQYLLMLRSRVFVCMRVFQGVKHAKDASDLTLCSCKIPFSRMRNPLLFGCPSIALTVPMIPRV